MKDEKVASYVQRITSQGASLWRGRKPFLAALDMELTERCNNNCLHCYINLPADDVVARSRELSTDEIKEYLRQSVSLGCLMVRFTGGEPLLREDFEDLYVFARRLGLKVLLFTNATLITPGLAELFSRIPPLASIEVTLYGMRKNSYESVTRVSGSFDAAWQGVNLLLERKIPFVVKGALLPSNREELEAFEAWASSIPWMDKPPTYTIFLDLRGRRDSQKKNRTIKGLRHSPEEVLAFFSRRPEGLTGLRDFCSKFSSPPGETLFPCGAGAAGGCVDAYGNLQACQLLRHPGTLYDLKKGSLRDAITHFLPRIKGMKGENLAYLNRCGHCFLMGLCEQCPARSWMEHGTLDTPVEYLCEMAHALARHAGLLGEDEKGWEVTNWKERTGEFSRKVS